MQKIMAGMLAGCLGLTFPACANNASAANPPYEQIASRNIFALVSPVPGPPPPLAENVPRVTLTGMMTIFGRPQVLLTARPAAQPGASSQNAYYVLGEQQSQDHIQVLHINGETGVVTMNNHGTVQEVILAGWGLSPLKAPGKK